MEEVSAHVHSGSIVPDVLTRQHKHRFGLIWSGDRDTCITDLQCKRFKRNLFQAYNGASPRCLCEAALRGVRQIGEALVLLQIRFMVSIGGTLGCTLSQHDIQQTFPGSRRMVVLESLYGSVLSGPSTSTVPPPSIGGTSYAPPSPGAMGSSFHAPPPLGTTGSSMPHMPIYYASSFDSKEHDGERTDDVTPAQQLGFGHRWDKAM
ncbi:hypothetical protein M9H77_25375 [Catharanthus roseus]|uniref:Uncharacterized protein n=1 Tax=Catharanthus roseus TaxID=4058 RepID=A0ACC0A9F0_CATRO|nr:hypothetical protein M9H77_25375 [Catharanthus roseus]